MRESFRLSRALLANAKAPFEPHLTELSILRGLSEGRIFAGDLMVSHHNNAKAKVISDSRMKLNCNGFITRNRALSGDTVYAELLDLEVDATPTSSSSETTLSENESITFEEVVSAADAISSKSCKVVGIQKRSGQRYVSRVKPGENLVQPRDTRFPAMRPASCVDVGNTSLALFNFTSWEQTEQNPDCTLVRVLGPEGSFEAEDDSSLEMKGLLSDPYAAETERSLRSLFPSAKSVVKSELLKRKDLRKSHRIFSIDPPSAKDLDDAISIEPFREFWKIGVHVADVSHFVAVNSEVDKQAALRATSVYLARKVYPMLPAYLSENLCSLLPGEDRLAVSVFFVLNEAGEIQGHPEMFRSVIRSQSKLDYDAVDSALFEEGPSNMIPKQVLKDIQKLHELTRILREKRISDGSVTIDDRNSEDLDFEFLDGVESGPVSVRTEAKESRKTSHDSHTLIEELMVMTNKIVAEKLCDSAELTTPVLRRHEDSEGAVVERAKEFLIKAGINVDASEIKSVSDLIMKAKERLEPGLFSVFTHSILGEFNRAEYVCGDSGEVEHWGVGARRYMHFTSPIRRYADLIVHRKLGHILGWQENSEDEEKIRLLIARCNTNSRLAKEAEKDNKLFYFTSLVKAFGNHGMRVEGFVKNLVAPDIDKNIKGSVCFFLPAIGDTRSQSLESLGLSVDKIDTFEDGTVKAVTAKNRNDEEISFRTFQRVELRAYVKNPNASISKLHIRIDPAPKRV